MFGQVPCFNFTLKRAFFEDLLSKVIQSHKLTYAQTSQVRASAILLLYRTEKLRLRDGLQWHDVCTMSVKVFTGSKVKGKYTLRTAG
jgi:hypothetical protein